MQEEEKIHIAVTGDIMLGESLDNNLNGKGFSFKDFDIIFGNLEGPLSDSGIPQKNKTLLNQNKGAAEILKLAGYNVLSIANNHIMDYGEKALDETIRILDRHSIKHTGAGMDIVQARQGADISIKGLKVIFLGYVSATTEENNPLVYAEQNNAGIAPLDFGIIKQDIENARKNNADIIVVSLHWGLDKYHYPVPEQIELAHSIVDTGANIIIGHHSHCLQGVEIYKNGLIAYSLGNFVFRDFLLPNGIVNKWIARNRMTAFLKLTISKEGIIDYEMFPLFANNSGDIVVLTGLRKKMALHAIKKWSDAVKDPFYKRNWKKRIRIDTINIFLERVYSKLK